ncbi:hypothetical protein CA85_40260 [Allorhodopirellula solitaria]|uniref:Uncharacterized protein n=1 Tax=Allorhodopirellula solitaria TaxID=2527987 RepID=A0A5C5X2T8_9BACT|nr:hypothetical protein CA85_40260 [Allorhodopirellula solitaria]
MTGKIKLRTPGRGQDCPVWMQLLQHWACFANVLCDTDCEFFHVNNGLKRDRAFRATHGLFVFTRQRSQIRVLYRPSLVTVTNRHKTAGTVIYDGSSGFFVDGVWRDGPRNGFALILGARRRIALWNASSVVLVTGPILAGILGKMLRFSVRS